MTEQLRVDQFRRDRAAVHAEKRAVGPRRLGVNHARDDFLARARLAEDENGRIVAGNQGHAFHDVLKSRIGAHDGIGQFLSAQPLQQRFLVGLGRRPHGSHLAEPLVVFQGHREGLEEGLDQADVRIFKGRAGLRHEHDDAGRVFRITERAGQNVGRHARRNDRRQKVVLAARTVLVQDLPLAAPRQQVLKLALVARGSGLRQ